MNVGVGMIQQVSMAFICVMHTWVSRSQAYVGQLWHVYHLTSEAAVCCLSSVLLAAY